MKLIDLERKLRELGFEQTHGGKHDVWKKGSVSIPVPRHREIKEYTAKAILKQAEKAP